MDGVHDMGGMDGFGKIEVEKNEPVFHASWEGRVLAMQRSMAYARAWNIDHSRFAQATANHLSQCFVLPAPGSRDGEEHHRARLSVGRGT